MHIYKKYLALILVVLMALLTMTGCGAQSVGQKAQTLGQTIDQATSQENQYGNKEAQGKLSVRMLDIGQGDAILIKVGDEYSMIDTGDVDHREAIVAQLKQEGVSHLKRVIITHPHADHMGGFVAIAKAIPVDEIYDDGIVVQNRVFKNYSQVIKDKGIKHTVLQRGDSIDFGNGAVFTVLAPFPDNTKTDAQKSKDLNNYSIVGKLTFGKFSMLFTGDMEKEEEAQLIQADNSKLFSRILKVAHHGSKYTTSSKFIRSVKPEAAFISCGLGNSYGHPGQETLDRLSKENIPVYITDRNGWIQVDTDGQSWQISKEK